MPTQHLEGPFTPLKAEAPSTRGQCGQVHRQILCYFGREASPFRPLPVVCEGVPSKDSSLQQFVLFRNRLPWLAGSQAGEPCALEFSCKARVSHLCALSQRCGLSQVTSWCLSVLACRAGIAPFTSTGFGELLWL